MVLGAHAVHGRFHCQTFSCARFDDWVPVPFNNTSTVCESVRTEVIDFMNAKSFEFKELENVGESLPSCRQEYCDALNQSANALLYSKGNESGAQYYGGDEDECRPLLDFNHSLCLSDYRDAEFFCDCVGPTLKLAELSPNCEEELLAFLTLGRRGAQAGTAQTLLDYHPISEFCSADICGYFAKIGNPAPFYPIEGVPSRCHEANLPYFPEQCMPLVYKRPYDPCPWEERPEGPENYLLCSDGTGHYIDPDNIVTWEVCTTHGYRAQCPSNFPVMCETRDCLGDHCCEVSVESCTNGRPRRCSSALTWLQEWTGELTPKLIQQLVTTTTMDPIEALLIEQGKVTTTISPGPSKVLENVVPIILAVVVAAGCCGGIIMFVYLSNTSFSRVIRSRVGVPRMLAKLKHSEVTKYSPEKPPAYHQEPLPPLICKHEVAKQRADRAAMKELQEAVEGVERMMPKERNMYVHPGCDIPEQEIVLQKAIAKIGERGLQKRGKNPAFLLRGDQWLRSIHAERNLLRVAAEAKPLYGNLSEQETRPPAEGHLPHFISYFSPSEATRKGPQREGRPWLATSIGKAAEDQAQRSKFDKVEELGEALKVAKAEGANKHWVEKTELLYSTLIAQVHELPSERCVLDPEGDGVKLLPVGTNRAVWVTGEVYTFNAETGEADELGEPPPPSEHLGAVSVDDARPVCAEFAKTGTCKYMHDRRCPWRHVKPKKGDTLRECIFFGEP